MPNFFYDIYDAFCLDTLIGKLLGGLMALLMLICVGLVGLFIFVGVNTLGLPSYTTTGLVSSVSYTPSTTTTTFTKVGDVMIPSTTTTAESYSAYVSTPVGTGYVSISESLYRRNPVNNSITVSYVIGRLTKSPVLISGY
jgi:hypothetical protein